MTSITAEVVVGRRTAAAHVDDAPAAVQHVAAARDEPERQTAVAGVGREAEAPERAACPPAEADSADARVEQSSSAQRSGDEVLASEDDPVAPEIDDVHARNGPGPPDQIVANQL
jgi:hypothetical protein